MLFAEVARTSAAVAATSSRTQKLELLAATLRQATPDEVPVVVTFLSGELRQRRPGVGWAALREIGAPAGSASLSVPEVDAAFEQLAVLAGAGSVGERRDRLAALFSRATAQEQAMLRGLVAGEVRQGALESLMVDAVARAAGAPVAPVRRAVMLRGALAPVAAALFRGGPAALVEFRLEVGRPVQPMLAQPAASVDAAFAKLGPAAWEWKLDGVRVQIHRGSSDVAVFTRTLEDITARVPEIVELTRSLPVHEVVLDGEAVALRPDGRPVPFQETASRIATRGGAGPQLTTFAFDVLRVDGADLLDAPSVERRAALVAAVPGDAVVPWLETADVAAARQFSVQTLAAGHEGVVAKALHAPYEAGRRGGAWLKVKPRHTLDLVVLAAEWGHGRRQGWLSNLHLGARDADGGFVMLGKTFKGLTDETLRWQTEQLLARAVSDPGQWVVRVRPELVVEVAFDGVQTSPRYPGGMALRFARVVRYRPDKTALEADPVDTVRALHAR